MHLHQKHIRIQVSLVVKLPAAMPHSPTISSSFYPISAARRFSPRTSEKPSPPCGGSASSHPHSLLSVLSLLPGSSARGPLGNQVPLVGGVPAAIPILFFLSCFRCQALQPVDLWETKSPLWGECQQPSPFSSFCAVSAARHFSPWTSGKPSPRAG